MSTSLSALQFPKPAAIHLRGKARWLAVFAALAVLVVSFAGPETAAAQPMAYDSACAAVLAAFALIAASLSRAWVSSVLAVLGSAIPAVPVMAGWAGAHITVFRLARYLFPDLAPGHLMPAPAAIVFLLFAPGVILAQWGKEWLSSRLSIVCGAVMLSVGLLPLIGLAAGIHPLDELVPLFGSSGVPCGIASCFLGMGILVMARRSHDSETRLATMTSVSAVFSLVVCSTLVGAAFLAMDAEAVETARIGQTYQAISALQTVRLLSVDTSHSDPRALRQALDQLGRLVADDPTQVRQAAALNQSLAAGSSQGGTARSLLEGMLAREQRVLAVRAQAHSTNVAFLKNKVVSALLLYALITALTALSLWREVSRRKTSQFDLIKQRDELEARVEERTRELKKFADTLRDREQQVRATFDAAAVGLAHVNPDGTWLRVNQELCRISGFSRKELEQMNFFDMAHPEDLDADRENMRSLLSGQISQFSVEKRHKHKHGHWVWVNLTSSLVRSARGDYFVFVVEDITQRKWGENALRESESRFKEMADAMPQIVWTAGPNGSFDYRNRRWYEFTGFPEKASADQVWKTILHPDDLPVWTAKWRSAIATGNDCQVPCRLWDRETSSHKWFLARAVATRDVFGDIVRWYGTCTDIDDHQRLSEELEKRVQERTSQLSQSIAEKETLLKEVHHRVKNNLQIVSSLLSMQLDTAFGDAADCLTQANQRVQSMALIHQQIYESPTLSDLDFSEYIEELAWQLFQTYCVDPERIQLEVDVQSVRLDLDQAIPCGLILNELVSNALKHAFPNSREGHVRIRLYPDSTGCVYFAVSDNGVGLPHDFAIGSGRSLGMHVTRILANQLGSELEISTGAETTFSIHFPYQTLLAA